MRKFILLIFIFIAVCRAGLQAQDIRLYYDIDYSLNFNRSVPIGMEIVTRDGKHLATKGFLKGKIPWRKLDIKVTGGYIKKGILYIDSSGKVTDQEKVQLDVYYKKLDIRKTIYLEMRFDGFQVADYKPGAPKQRAARGGRIFGKIFITLTGKEGRKGRKGIDGPLLKVFLSMRKIDAADILVAKVMDKETKRTGTFLINPHKGTLLIRADGGNGGDGGEGGDGVDDDDNPSAGGTGGDGGRGGNGGSIEVVVTKEARPFLYCIKFSTEAGMGGRGGAGGKGGVGSNSHGDNGEDGKPGPDGINGTPAYFTNNTP